MKTSSQKTLNHESRILETTFDFRKRNIFRIQRYLTSLLFMFFIFNGFATDYYVSPSGNNNNDGTFSSPWKTINYAVNYQALQGGDIIYLRGGTYVESVIMTKSGNTSNRILVKNYNNEVPIINGQGLAYDYYWRDSTGLFNVRASYITVDGLKVMNANPNSDAGNATGIIVRGPNVTDVTIRNCVTVNTRSSGIAIWGQTTGNDYSGCRNIIVENCDISGAVNDGYNEHLTIALGVENYIIRYNKVHDQTAVGRAPNLPIGIDSKVNVRNGKIYGNEIYNLRKSNGIYVDAWDSEAYNIEIFNNIIHDIDHNGIPIGAEEGGTAHDIKVYNNLIYNVGWNGISMAGSNNTIAEGDNNVYNVSIYNNTVYGSNQYAMHIPNKNVENIKIKNNIFVGNKWSNAATINAINRANIDMSHNVTFGDQNAFLPGMEILLGTNHISKNPIFAYVDGNNFRLQETSPAIDTGTNSLVASTDLDDKNRPIGINPDIGAYEFGENSNSVDVISSISGSETVIPGNSYDINIDYETSTNREIIVLFQQNRAPWTIYGQKKINVTKGKGSVNINIYVDSNTPVASNEYKWTSFIVPVGGDFDNNLSIKQKVDISTSLSPSANNVWYLENKPSKQWLGVNNCSLSNLGNIPLVLVTNNGNDACNVFEFIPSEGEYFFLQNQFTKGRYRSQNCSNAADDSIEIVQVGEASFGWCEQWRLVDAGEGFYRIENRQTGGWIRSKGCSGEIGTSITQVDTSYSGDCTLWKLIDAGTRNRVSEIPEALEDNVVSFYPNPANNELILRVDTSLKEMRSIKIYDLQGREAKEISIDGLKEGTEKSIDVSGIANGLYILSVDFIKGDQQNSQFIIKH